MPDRVAMPMSPPSAHTATTVSETPKTARSISEPPTALKGTYDPYKHYSAKIQLQQVASGAISGAITRTLTQPFDVLKIRFQLQVEPVAENRYGGGVQGAADPQAKGKGAAKPQSKYTSMSQAVRLIYREEGLRAFWKGHNSGQYMSIIFCIAQFWSYEQIYMNIGQLQFLDEHYYLRDFISGGLAGCVAATVSMPFDVIRTRMVAQDPGTGYKRVIQAMPTIIRQEGFSGLFRGTKATLIQIFPLIGLNFCFYNLLNDVAVDIMKRPRKQLPGYVHFTTGFLAGVISKGVLYPLDFIKKRLQIQGFEQHRQTYGQTQQVDGIMHCIRETLKHEGVLGFYKGLMPTLLKSGAQSAFYFAIYNYAKILWDST